MLACLALRASAKPPARLGADFPLSGVARPLPLPPPFMLILTALSLRAGGGNGFLPAGRFVGGMGATGFTFETGRPDPLRIGVDAGGSWRTIVGGGGGVGGGARPISSLR